MNVSCHSSEKLCAKGCAMASVSMLSFNFRDSTTRKTLNKYGLFVMVTKGKLLLHTKNVAAQLRLGKVTFELLTFPLVTDLYL